MTDTTLQPESTAVRVALWRALHVEVDAPPHVLDDQIGLRAEQTDELGREMGLELRGITVDGARHAAIAARA